MFVSWETICSHDKCCHVLISTLPLHEHGCIQKQYKFDSNNLRNLHE